MRVTAFQLRAELDHLLDRVIETGEPLEVERNGVIVRIVRPPHRSWLDRLPRREGVVTGDADDLVHLDWSCLWSPDGSSTA